MRHKTVKTLVHTLAYKLQLQQVLSKTRQQVIFFAK